MNIEEWPKDGATNRRRRLMDIITFIANWNRDQGPCTERTIQTFMLLKHGNKRDTVTHYLRELQDVGVLSFDRKTGHYKLRKSYAETVADFAAVGEGVGL